MTAKSSSQPTDVKVPKQIETEEQLDELLSRPTAEVIALFTRLRGPLAIIGGGGKIGPSLVNMACRARQAAGGRQRIFVVDRFPEPVSRRLVRKAGADVVQCDLLDPKAVAKLPPASDVIYMAGMKFGTTDRPWLTWAVNALIPDYVARRYRGARTVAFSTGCVYDLVPVRGSGSKETDPLEPIGEYPNSCIARERVFEYVASLHKTPLILFRLNYAVELRYGVLVDLAAKIVNDQPIDLGMGYFNAMWQGDVNAAALRLLEHATYPPRALNVTSREKYSVRKVCEELALRMGRKVRFTGRPAATALHSDVTAVCELLGDPPTPLTAVIDWVAHWVGSEQRLLGKPTHFETRDGRY